MILPDTISLSSLSSGWGALVPVTMPSKVFPTSPMAEAFGGAYTAMVAVVPCLSVGIRGYAVGKLTTWKLVRLSSQ